MATNLDATPFLGPVPSVRVTPLQSKDPLATCWQKCLDRRPGIVIRCLAALHQAFQSCLAPGLSRSGSQKAAHGVFARAQAQVELFEKALEDVVLTLAERAPCVPDCYLMQRVRSEAMRWFPDNEPAQLRVQADTLTRHFEARRPALVADVCAALRDRAGVLVQGREGYDPFNAVDQLFDAVYEEVMSAPHWVWAKAKGLECFAEEAWRQRAAGAGVTACEGSPHVRMPHRDPVFDSLVPSLMEQAERRQAHRAQHYARLAAPDSEPVVGSADSASLTPSAPVPGVDRVSARDENRSEGTAVPASIGTGQIPGGAVVPGVSQEARSDQTSGSGGAVKEQSAHPATTRQPNLIRNRRDTQRAGRHAVTESFPAPPSKVPTEKVFEGLDRLWRTQMLQQ